MEATATKKILSTPTTNKGFTLIEVLIVIGLIALLFASVSLPTKKNYNRKIKTELRKMAVMSRYIHELAKLHHLTYRLVIDLRTGKDSTEPHQYWVEKTSKTVFFKKASNEKKKKKSSRDPDGFEKDPHVMKHPRELPSGLYFESVELASSEKPIKEGIAYIYYLPEGLAQEAVVHIKHKKYDELNWSLAVLPLTGKGKLIPKNISLKELQEQ
ncbi:MAG: type II secretion system protein [Bdellovibrio sp.]|nr:MAG: type II secretion system protein [Bdellovibrio sp.]